MNKVLGIDLGTNSIGLSLRKESELDWCGVYTFKKGVGEGKSGEFSFAAERTKHRASRRLYNARRYRKWETLKVLVEFDFCPLSNNNLNKWKHYVKGVGRKFPIDDEAFQQWIKLDFNQDGKPDFNSPYQLRRLLILENLDLSIQENRFKVGRAFYHMAQRRGFKSSRKQGQNEKTAVYKGSGETKTIGRDEYDEIIKKNGSLGAAFAFLEDNGIRVRNRYTLRSDYLSEAQKIIDFQNIKNVDFVEKIKKAIFFQRPLRSQKGLIGKCTLETHKPRCPISHPKFEEYRAWSFINNIKIRNTNESEFRPLPLDLKNKLYHEKFFFKSKRDFLFKEIREYIHRNGDNNWTLNYSAKMDRVAVPSCYVSARFKAVFGDDWGEFKKEVTQETNSGIKVKTYTIEDIWHILFSFDDVEYFEEFLKIQLELNENQIKELIILFNSFPIGYANLSSKAINNILPFLRKGMLYSDAVILGKIPEIIGFKTFENNEHLIVLELQKEISKNREKKKVTNILNHLISKYYALDYQDRFGWKDRTYKLDKSDLAEVEIAIKEYHGEITWEQMDAIYKQRLITEVTDKYQTFFSSLNRVNTKPPHLVNQIKDFLIGNFDVDAKKVDTIYHPSQINIYPKKEGQKFLTSPKTAAFKNPMAYKTLYKLRRIINYLIETERIDEDTKVIVEIARDLNDSNKRWAIEKWQRDRESENREFAIAISELINDPDFNGKANPNSETDINKIRLWTDQLIDKEEFLKTINTTSDDLKKYRLWKEQDCSCIYTGKIIKLTDLFNQNKVDFEHTIPRSKCFDNSLANLTVCYADYNRTIKKNKLPTELPNYDTTTNGYSAIKPRLGSWEKKVHDLFNQINTQRNKAKKANDKNEKDDAIKKRHLLQMEYDYWLNKLDRFKRTEVPQGFKNSQLIDTQIISKYAYHYLKTVFNKVDVIKGSNTSDFRKIYGIQPKETLKDRTKHYHHAIDALVLTMIPQPKKREEILKKAYEYEEENKGKQYHQKPFAEYSSALIDQIKEHLLINNLVDEDRTLQQAKKKVRKRGRITWLKNENGEFLKDVKGNKLPKIAQGDSIRGELHTETYYGKIKIAAKDESGSLKRDTEGKILYNQKNGKDEMWMVLRKPIENINFKTDKIVDEHLAKYLKSQLSQGIDQYNLKDFQGNTLRHVRCRVKAARGFMKPENATVVKEQTYKSKKDYKSFVYADSGENYMFGLYENENGKSIVPFNKLEAAKYMKHVEDLSPETFFKAKEPVFIGRGKKAKTAALKHVFMVGQKVILFEENKEELRDLENKEISKRLYFVKTLFDAKQGLIRFQHHLEARNDKQLVKSFPSSEFGQKGKNGFSKFTTDFIAPRLLLSPNNFNFIIENKDFKMELDGFINLKY